MIGQVSFQLDSKLGILLQDQVSFTALLSLEFSQAGTRLFMHPLEGCYFAWVIIYASKSDA